MGRIDTLKRQLREHKLARRLDAIKELATMPDDAAVDALKIALSDMTVVDQNWQVRVCDLAAEALEEIASPAALAVLEDWQHDPMPYLVKALHREDRAFMIPALKVLETMPVNKDRAKALLSLRSSYDPELHRRARIEIKRLGRQAIGPLLQLIQPENEVFYRKHATYFLGELRAASAVPDLLKMLNDEDEDLREYAATALGKIGDPTAVPALIHLLSDIITTYPSPERLVCQSAVDALEQIGTPAAVQAMQAWRHDPVPFFINGLQSPLVKLRRKQAWTLYKYPQKSVVKTLIDALEDPDSEVRRGAAWSLGQIGDSDAVQPLLNILPSASRIVCATVIMALGSLRAAEAIPVITEYLSDTRTYHHNQRISDAAAEALRKIKQV